MVDTLSRSLGDGARGCLTTGLGGKGGGFAETDLCGRSGGPKVITDGLSGVESGV